MAATKDETWRVFCAIELPLGLRTRLIDRVTHLQSLPGNARASWNRIDNLHLTLNFLGDTPAHRVEALSLAASRAAHNVNPFQVEVAGCGSFPPQGTPRVLWIGIEDPEKGLGKLYRALEAECHAAGFARDQRPFHAHITIARLRHPDSSARNLAQLHLESPFASCTFTVNAIVVMRSILEASGSRYLTVARRPLGSTDVPPADNAPGPPVA